MLHYIKRDEKLQGCSRCLIKWSNKDPKSALGTQTAKGRAGTGPITATFLQSVNAPVRGCSSHAYRQAVPSAGCGWMLNTDISGIQL